MEWLNAVVQGLLLGGQYALLASGLSLIFGVMRIVNLAHGVIAVTAAYLTMWLISRTGMSPFVSLLVVVPILFGVGYLLQTSLFNAALRKGALAPLLVSFGLAVVASNVLQQVFSANTRSIDIGALGTSSFRLASGLSVGLFSLLTFGVSILVTGGLQLFLGRTQTGRAMRATSDDADAAALVGIDNRHIYALATAIALGIVAVAGVFLGMHTQFSPTYGDLVLIFAFEAVIIGGLGSMWGTLVGGIVLGVAQTIGAQVSPAYGILVGHVVFLVILAFRPNGLLAKVVAA